MKKYISLSISVLFFIHIQLSGQILNVKEVTQEHNQWCWAGVSASLLDFYCTPTAQCAIAEYARSVITWYDFGTTNCCTDPSQGCNYWNYAWGSPGSIQDILIHFANITNNGVSSFLTKAEIASNLQLNRPFIVRWGWVGGGGHFVVGHGLSGENVYYMDPWYGEGLKIADYSWIRYDGNHTWTHTNVMTVSSAKPSAPVITLNGSTLHSSAATGNQWYNQTGLIAGATGQDYSPVSTGDYHAKVIVNSCNSGPSNTLNFISTTAQVTKQLTAGWTWFSLNVRGADMAVPTVLSNLAAKDGDYIKNQTASSTFYTGAGWFGDLTEINPKEMYKIKLGEAGTLKYTGVPVDPATNPIAIKNGWNWIGYLPQTPKTVSGALSCILPVADDFIKNQTLSNTFYEGAGWFGELINLEPFDGYMLKTTHTGSLDFQESGSGTFTDARDGKSYRWVKIGDQNWMAENLAWLPSVNLPSASSETLPIYFVIGYSGTSVSEAKATANYSSYGVLYNWPAAVAGSAGSASVPSGVQGICPAGWHLPSDAEWTILTDYMTNNGYGFGGSGSDIAKSLAATTGWAEFSTEGAVGNDQATNNKSGFGTVPGGEWAPGLGFDGIRTFAAFWTATPSGSLYASDRDFYFANDGIASSFLTRNYAFSVRCIRD